MKEIVLNITSASLVELTDAKKQLEAIIAEKQHREKAAVKNQIRQLAKTYNLSVEEVLDIDDKKVKTVKPKYQHPENAALQWTGRGRHPLWVKELYERGIDLESMRIAEEEAA